MFGVKFYYFYMLYNDGKIENAPVPDLHGCPNINLLEGDNISSFFPVNNRKKKIIYIQINTFFYKLTISFIYFLQ